MEINEFESILGKKKDFMQIFIKTPKEKMCRGLRYFIGDDAKWLQGYDEIAEWLQDNKRTGLLLYGANGRGKSIMCYHIIPTLIEYYYKSTKIFKCRANALRNIVPENNDYYNMLSASILFIDDFGMESITSIYGEKRDVFSDIVDLAEQEKKLLVMSTNLTPDEIKKRYGLRTLDRLLAVVKPICLIGVSMRDARNAK